MNSFGVHSLSMRLNVVYTSINLRKLKFIPLLPNPLTSVYWNMVISGKEAAGVQERPFILYREGISMTLNMED